MPLQTAAVRTVMCFRADPAFRSTTIIRVRKAIRPPVTWIPWKPVVR